MRLPEKLKPYLQPTFLACIVILLLAGTAMSALQTFFNVHRIKERIPLDKPLASLDETALAPYVVKEKQQISNPEILRQLSADDYVQWVLEDTNAPPDSPVKFCLLFITYYTGTTEQVWHTPEECYIAAGNKNKSDENLHLSIDYVWPPPHRTTHSIQIADKQTQTRTIPVTCLGFTPKANAGDIIGSDSDFFIFYTFNVNNGYAAGRNKVRWRMEKNLTSKYSYFSKVEWKFLNNNAGFGKQNKQVLIEASQKLLSRLIPLLENDHWPDISNPKKQLPDAVAINDSNNIKTKL